MFKFNSIVCKYYKNVFIYIIFVLIILTLLPFVYASTKFNYEDDIELLAHLRHHKTHSKDHHKTQTSLNVFPINQPQENMYDDDDLIYSGSGCFEDEDKCSEFTDTDGSGDDIITLVYIPPKPSTISPFEKSCDEDDEDCLSQIKSQNRNIFSEEKKPFISYSSPKSIQVWTQSNYIESNSYTLPPTDNYKVTLPVRILIGPIYHTTRKFIPPRPTGIPSVNYVPPPQAPIEIKVKEEPPPPVTHKSSADKTAMIIGLVAIMLILIVIIAPFILFIKIKYKMGIGYKNNSNTFGFIPKTSTLPLLDSSHQSQFNETLVRSLSTEKSLKVGKNLKEWYV